MKSPIPAHTQQQSAHNPRAHTSTISEATLPGPIPISGSITSFIGDSTKIKTYDPLGRRSSRTAYTTTSNHGHHDIAWNKESNQSYLYDGLSFNLLAELKDTQFRVDNHGRTHRRTTRYQWQPINEYLYGNGRRLISKTAFATNERFGTRYPRHTDKDYYLQDVLGSVVGLTDERGNQKKAYSFDVWGNRYDRLNQTNSNHTDNGWNVLPAMVFGFNGKRFDPKVGLYDYGFRDYKPKVARWTTVDPIHAGTNWYAYVENDPVNLRDLWGLEVLIEQIIEGIVDIAAGSTIVTGAAVVEYFSGGLASPGVAVAVMGGVSQISYGIAEIATAFYGDEIPSSTDLLLEVASYGFAETGFDPPSVEVKEGN